MLFKLNDNLGTLDARKCNDDFGAALPIDPVKLARGETIDLPKPAAEYLAKRYPALLESKVRGEAKDAEVRGVKS